MEDSSQETPQTTDISAAFAVCTVTLCPQDQPSVDSKHHDSSSDSPVISVDDSLSQGRKRKREERTQNYGKLQARSKERLLRKCPKTLQSHLRLQMQGLCHVAFQGSMYENPIFQSSSDQGRFCEYLY